MKHPFLIGENLYLRALSESDVDGSYVDWLNDSDVCEHNSHHVFPYSKESARTYIQSVNANKNSLVLAMCLKSSDQHIGNIALQNIDTIAMKAEFAIIMGDKQQWGKGYAKEAAYLLCNHGFMALNLNRIYCGTSETNIAMQKLASYLGMTQEGCRRQSQFKRGHYLDLLEYGILRYEFLTKFQLEKTYQESLS